MMAQWVSKQSSTGVRLPLRELGLCLAMTAVLLALSSAAPVASHAAPQGCVGPWHSGTIAASEEWCLTDSPHYVTGNVSVASGATLTVEAGVEIRFNNGLILNVLNGGALVAEGSLTQPITFTVATAGNYWAGIAAGSGSTLRLAHCDLAHVGSDADHRGISVDASADVEVRHCRIHDMDPHQWSTGLVLRGNGLTGVFEDLEIDHNSNAVSQNTVNMNPTYINLHLHDNGVDAVAISAGYGGTALNQDVTLDGSPIALNGAPIHLPTTTVGAGHALTVTAGTTLKMTPGALLNITGGALTAEGTPAQPITFTALTTNWAGVAAGSGSRLRLGHCDVAYAGSDAVHRGISVEAGGDAQISNSRIHHTSGSGLLVNGGQITVRNLALADNTWFGLSVQSGAQVNGLHLTLARNSFAGANVEATGAVALTNSILAGNATGIRVVSGGSATLSHTLWDSNTTPIVGTVSETGHMDGPAAFDADGYHLSRYSAALGRGMDAGVADDIDGQARPLPAGTFPDLGADEDPGSYVYLPLVLRPSP